LNSPQSLLWGIISVVDIQDKNSYSSSINK
jgi:hypothetical protein